MSTYSAPAEVAAATRALSAKINEIITASTDAFGLLPDEDDIYTSRAPYGTSGGTADTYTFVSNRTQTAYVDGMEVVFKPVATNLTTTPTINVDALGSKTITRRDGVAVAATELPANKFTALRYNETSGNFEIMNPISMETLSVTLDVIVGTTSGTVCAGDDDRLDGYPQLFLLGGF